ncbi:hypothetical protein Syun_024127 [Stephania yunnanensis]|uniref:U3 small nucleolar ribonucleoprotein protein MPP10 n=1 Tax=Stephania yunnanensis TaxID=152371 RepID=A0AAP0FB84_9MAGN
MAASPSECGGVKALQKLRSAEPPQWLSPSPDLAEAARAASDHLFSSLRPFCPKSPFDRLLIDGFDAEQIWQQIETQTQPLVSSLRRELKWFERNPVEIGKGFGARRIVEERGKDLEVPDEGFEDFEEQEKVGFDVDDDDDDDGEDDVDDEEEEEERRGGGGIEDRFLKIKELEEYMEDDEAREYGDSKRKRRGHEEEEDDEDEDIEGLGGSGSEDEDMNARYDDFFGGEKDKGSKKKQKLRKESKDMDDYEDMLNDDSNEDDEPENGSDEGLTGDDANLGQPEEGTLSTHEKHLKKLRLKIEQMEKANLEPKTWAMQGEVTAAKRPKNSALEVDLDFEHNVRPAPVITEEVTTSLENLIKLRILDGHFDDVQRLPSLPSKGPREKKELDENKSKKGLAEIYENFSGMVPFLLSNEMITSFISNAFLNILIVASLLFKKICLKLDALSHFHFTPKPIVEDMSIQSNIPALAMEEVTICLSYVVQSIAPMAISDAAMLAPEEVFAGKGDIKDKGELTQAERKRRRANKKRKFKVVSAVANSHAANTIKRMEMKARSSTVSNAKGEEES